MDKPVVKQLAKHLELVLLHLELILVGKKQVPFAVIDAKASYVQKHLLKFAGLLRSVGNQVIVFRFSQVQVCGLVD